MDKAYPLETSGLYVEMIININTPAFQISKNKLRVSEQRSKCRITAILKVKTDIIANISRAGMFVIMSVEAFRTDMIVLIGDIIMCFPSD